MDLALDCSTDSFQLGEFVKKLRGADVDVERRAAARVPMIEAINIKPLDELFQPAGPPTMALMRNVSRSGIALLHVRPVNSRYLALCQVRPQAAETPLYMEIIRCRQIGSGFELAGPFVSAE
jgi:hypothetical protein